jgi:hypothetical protein
VSPRQQAAASIGLTAIGAGREAIEIEPSIELRVVRIPGECLVVAVTRGNDTALTAGMPPCAQSRDRIGQVLQDLVSVHDMEVVEIRVERIGVADSPLDGVAQSARVLDDRPRGIETHDSSWRDTRGEIDGDCPRPAPDVEQTQAWPEMIEQVRGGVLCRSPRV